MLISLFISVKVSTIDAFCPSGSDKESVILNCLPILQKNFPNIDPFKCQKEKYFVKKLFLKPNKNSLALKGLNCLHFLTLGRKQ